MFSWWRVGLLIYGENVEKCVFFDSSCVKANLYLLNLWYIKISRLRQEIILIYFIHTPYLNTKLVTVNHGIITSCIFFPYIWVACKHYWGSQRCVWRTCGERLRPSFKAGNVKCLPLRLPLPSPRTETAVGACNTHIHMLVRSVEVAIRDSLQVLSSNLVFVTGFRLTVTG